MSTRRSFLGSILAAATPPGFVQPVSGMELMANYERSKRLIRSLYEGDRWTDGELLRFINRSHSALVINRISA